LKTDHFILNAGVGMRRAWTAHPRQEHQQSSAIGSVSSSDRLGPALASVVEGARVEVTSIAADPLTDMSDGISHGCR
jgi:hypothetical protein